MNKFILIFILFCSVLFAKVNYYFENSQLIIKGLEMYDQIKVTVNETSFTVNSGEIKIPWQKYLNIPIEISPLSDTTKKIVLNIDASKDLPPKIDFIISGYYVTADRLSFPIKISDDWDELDKLTMRFFLDGNQTELVKVKDGFLEIDNFFIHSGEHALRIVCKDSNSNVTDKTYRFFVVPHLPSPPAVNGNNIISSRTHRAYWIENGELYFEDSKSNSLKKDMAFICDVDGAGNESFPSLLYQTKINNQISPGNIITLNSGILANGEYTVFGKIVIPSGETVLIRSGGVLRIPAGCEIAIKGNLIAESGSKILGQGKLIITDEGKLILNNSKIEVQIVISGASMFWGSNLDLSRSYLEVNRSLAISLKNVKAKQITFTNVRKLWINSCEISQLTLKHISSFLINDSKINRINVSDFSKGKIYSTSFYSEDTALSLENFSFVQMIDSWLSAKKCVQIQDYSVMRVRSTQFNADTGVVLSGYSIFDSFACMISASIAIQLRDSRATLLKTELLGEVVKIGKSEFRK
ncbi:hypothetical protein [Pseudothermotoga elfii]|uniref:hypothetical protein n=1 Tax=Pseudothermotoga elfii TaxID=38322 RepID=UPI00048AEEFE|nr:hypothetical protein [Pseudothermotoga elfii]